MKKIYNQLDKVKYRSFQRLSTEMHEKILVDKAEKEKPFTLQMRHYRKRIVEDGNYKTWFVCESI